MANAATDDLLAEMTAIPNVEQILIVRIAGDGQYGAVIPVPNLREAYYSVRYFLEQPWVIDATISVHFQRRMIEEPSDASTR